MRTVPLRIGNQKLSKLVQEVENGQKFLIIQKGHPIAELVPHRADKTTNPNWNADFRRMMSRLREGASLGGRKGDLQSPFLPFPRALIPPCSVRSSAFRNRRSYPFSPEISPDADRWRSFLLVR